MTMPILIGSTVMFLAVVAVILLRDEGQRQGEGVDEVPHDRSIMTMVRTLRRARDHEETT